LADEALEARREVRAEVLEVVLDALERPAGEALHEGADRLELLGDKITDAVQSVHRAGDALEHALQRGLRVVEHVRNAVAREHVADAADDAAGVRRADTDREDRERTDKSDLLLHSI